MMELERAPGSHVSDESFVVIVTEFALVESPTRMSGSLGRRNRVVAGATEKNKIARITEKILRVSTS